MKLAPDPCNGTRSAVHGRLLPICVGCGLLDPNAPTGGRAQRMDAGPFRGSVWCEDRRSTGHVADCARDADDGAPLRVGGTPT